MPTNYSVHVFHNVQAYNDCNVYNIGSNAYTLTQWHCLDRHSWGNSGH